MFSAYDVVVTNRKNELISDRKLDNNKIYSLNEFINKLFFSYDVKTIYYVMNEYGVIYDIAKIYLDNIRYIEDKEYKSDKINFLRKLKNDLIAKDFLYEDRLFKKYLTGKKILFYGIEKTKELEKIKYNIDYVDIENKKYEHSIYNLKNLEEEVLFVANKICELIESSVDINKIFLVNIDEEYRKVIRRIFPMFNIRFNLLLNDGISSTYIVNKFLELYSNDMDNVLEQLSSFIISEDDKYIYDQIVKVLNRYVEFDNYLDVKSLVKEDLKKIKLKSKKYIKAVNEIDKEEFSDDEYVFLLGFNQGVIPIIHKDEDYLNDEEKDEIGLSLTVDKNVLERKKVAHYLGNIKNLFLTSKESHNGEEYKISNINEELNYEVIDDIKIDKKYSNTFNKIYLTNLKDLYNKYGSVGEDLSLLEGYYNDLDYNTYNNEFTGIDKELLCRYIDNKITLSYSSLDKYYRCPFSYYLDRILKINVYEETFYQIIGTLFHAVLQKYFDKEDSFDNLWTKEIGELKEKLGVKELFFLNKLKDELSFVIETIEYQETLTDLHEELHEEKIYVSISGKISVTFTGIVDKIKYKEVDDGTVVALIDYKTGNADLDLSLLPYGIGLQLPVYIYLAKNDKKFKNVKIAGFYLQKILNNEESNNDNKDYKMMKRKNLLLQGFSNANKDILSLIDNSYEDSNLIKSMKVKNDGDFSVYSKVLTVAEMDTIEEIVKEKIDEGVDKISNASFEIAPKSVDGKNISCSFCSFKDICYKKNEDVVELQKLTTEEVLGGGSDGLD